uniref:Rab-GAP TBC domain-containing protein n=1 Tax=Ciona savignyi TaxID=51511 RepID=H2Z7P5_CIOSA
MMEANKISEVATLISDIVGNLNGTTLQAQLKRAAQVCMSEKGTVTTSSLKSDVINALKSCGWDKVLRNEVFKQINCIPRCMDSNIPFECQKEPLMYMRKAQANWERRILKSMNSMCTELSIPLARKRPAEEQRDLLHKWNEMGTDEPDLSHFRPVYAPKDFLEVISSVRNPNYCSLNESSDALVHCEHWGLIQVPLEVPNLAQLQKQFADFSSSLGQGGLDDSVDAPTESFQNDRNKLAKRILDEKRSVLAQHFCRRGCPSGNRAELWQLALGVTVDHLAILKYDQLKGYVLQHDLLVDSLIYKDVKLTSVNDDYYFVFEDYLYQVLLVFSRDTTVLQHFAQSSATPPKSYIRGKLGLEEFSVLYPPNGVIPFHGFSMYATPLCYLYSEPVRLYYTFRELYMRYFHRLHSISSHPQGIISLCLLFETTLQSIHPRLFRHLLEIGCQPLKIAFKWLVRGFSGYLATDQLLLLWDRIVGYGSLVVLPLLAVAVFLFRQSNLLLINSASAVEGSLADITTLHVVPLLQLVLFPT